MCAELGVGGASAYLASKIRLVRKDLVVDVQLGGKLLRRGLYYLLVGRLAHSPAMRLALADHIQWDETHALNTFSNTICLANGSKLEYSLEDACSKSAQARRSVGEGTRGVPWSGYLSAMYRAIARDS